MNNKLIDEINFKFCEIEEGLEQIHTLSRLKTISSICEIQEIKENIIAKQKSIIDLLDINTLEIDIMDTFVTRLENTAHSLSTIK